MKKKNADYATTDDPLFNFRRHGAFGMVVRMDDKTCRIDQFVKKGKFEVDESIEDTLKDLINYCVLLSFWYKEGNK